MICSVLQPRERNPEVDIKALDKERDKNFIEGIVNDVTNDYIEVTIGSGEKGSIRLYFEDATCGYIMPCFIGDKAAYSYFYDSLKPVNEDNSSLYWAEACVVQTDYGTYKGEALGYKVK